MSAHTVPVDVLGLREEAEALAREAFGALGVELYRMTRCLTVPWERLTNDERDVYTSAQAALLSDLTRPASRDLWIRWLLAGQRCALCGGEGRHIEQIDAPPCAACHRSGWSRPAYDLRWASDISGTLSPTQAAAVLAWSVRSVNRGGTPIVGIERALTNGSSLLAGTFAGQPFRWACGYTDGKHDWNHFGFAIRRCSHCYQQRPAPGHEDYWKTTYGEATFPPFESVCPGTVLDYPNGDGWRWGRLGGKETGDAALELLHGLALGAQYALLDADGGLLLRPESTS